MLSVSSMLFCGEKYFKGPDEENAVQRCLYDFPMLKRYYIYLR